MTRSSEPSIRGGARVLLGLIERRWWSVGALSRCTGKLLPSDLPDLAQTLLDGRFPSTPQRPDRDANAGSY
jgi:hypothetical protein